MFHILKKRLTILCGITTSIILTIVVILSFLLNYNQSNHHSLELFNNNVDTILEKLRYSYMINQNYLNEMESDNNLIIYIEDNGHPIPYKGHLTVPNNRQKLIEIVKKKALDEGLTSSLNPITSEIKTSLTFSLKTDDNEYYRGLLVIIPNNLGWKNLIVIEWIPKRNYTILTQVLLYLFIDIIGCSLLFLLSYIFISKAIKPVEENQKRQVEFIAAASHELRSPLTVIKAAVSSIEKDNLSSVYIYLPHIETECNRMTRLISDMLLLATSDAKTWTLKKEIIDMDTFLIETFDLFFPVVSGNCQNLNLDLPDEPLNHLQGDKERIRQIINIIIDNAMEYSPKYKNITIKAYNSYKSVTLEVIDEGKGINDEQKKLIFNRFYRGDKSRNSKKHFGLGLNIALELTSLHNGSITIKDTVGGDGSTFVVKLPSL